MYAHPSNKKANQYGQLGFRKLKILNHTAAITSSPSHMDVELIPNLIFLADTFWNPSRPGCITIASTVSDNIVDIYESKIRFCLSLFEIPVLRGIAHIAAGSRTSFGRTRNGRVLGWGANEYGFTSALLLIALLV